MMDLEEVSNRNEQEDINGKALIRKDGFPSAS
jgi:hypothetical protein